MIRYIVRRIIYMVFLIFLTSVLSFVIIQLPEGDYLDVLIEQLRQRGMFDEMEQVRELEERYGLDLPVYRQYLKWIGGFFRGDLGHSFVYTQPVAKLVKERLPMTVVLSFSSMLFVYLVALPIGIYSATHQYSVTDYTVTVLGYIGLATPNFLLAMVLMVVFFSAFGWSPGGLFSPEYQVSPWSWGKFLDLLKHLPVPVVVVGTAGMAGMIRVMRGTLLDELHKAYVIAARAKGVKELKLLFKYPVRIAINPMVSGIGGILVGLISGGAIVSIIISLPTMGPLMLTAVMNEDMYLAGSLTFIYGSLGLLGILISDLLLVVVDPRIKFYKGPSQ
jgi:peptide/nickel transport system permease protein